MRCISRPLLYRFNRGLAEVYDTAHGSPEPLAFAQLLGELLESELTVVGHRRADQSHAIRWLPVTLDLTRQDAAYEQHVASHPVRNRFRARREPGPHRLSDVVSLAAFKQGGLYCDYFRHFGVTRLMATYVPLGDGEHLSLGVSRGGRDFTDDERFVLSLGQPHLMAAARRQIRAEVLAALPATPVESAAVETGRRGGLTTREIEIFEWIAAGKTNPEIAVILGVSRWTVKTHVERILGKLGVENRTSAMALLTHQS